MVLAFLSEIALRRGSAKIWVADKRYAAWLKIVDFIIEPFVQERGGNIYRDGANHALASMLHICVPAFASPDVADQIITSSMTFLKSGTSVDRQSLLRILDDAAQRFPTATDTLSYIHGALQSLPVELFAALPLQRIDMAFGAALQLMAWWRSESTDEIHVVHDQTANMSRRKDIWDAITDRGLKPFEDRAASGMVMKFPIAAASTTFAPSDQHAGLQLADVLAGAIGCSLEASGTGDRAAYAQAVLERIGEMSIHALIPHEEISPERMGTLGLDGNRSLDYLTERFATIAAARVPPHEPK